MIIKVECSFPVGTLRFATQPFQDSNGNWDNKIIEMGTLDRNIAEDRYFQVSGVNITLDDSDRYFRDMMTDSTNKYISGKTVKIMKTDDTVLYEGVISNWGYIKDVFFIDVSDKLNGIEEYLTDTIQSGDYDDTVSDAIGVRIPIIYGELYDTLGAVKCYKTSEGSYLVAAHYCKNIDNVFENDIEIDSGSWSIDNNADGKCYITYSGTEDYIIANVKGSMDGSSNLITEPIEALRDLIDNYTSMGYDTSSLTTSEIVMKSRKYIIDSMITSETIEEYLSVFCITFSSDFYFTENNEIAISTIDNYNYTSVASYNQNVILLDSFSTFEDPEKIENKIKYMYYYNYVGDYYNKLPVQEKTSNWGVFANNIGLKATNDFNTAYDSVNRLLLNKSDPKREVYFSLPLANGIDLNIADMITVIHPQAIEDTPEVFQVRQINSIDFIGDSISLKCLKIPIMTNGFILGDNTILPLTWNAAVGSDRDYGYLCDRTDEYFSNNIDLGKILT